MFTRVLALLPFALLISASHLEARDQCNTGGIYCCNSVQSANQAASILSLFDLAEVAAEVGAMVGIGCSGVSVVGGSTGCDAKQQPVCCKDNKYNGVLNFGCSSINF